MPAQNVLPRVWLINTEELGRPNVKSHLCLRKKRLFWFVPNILLLKEAGELPGKKKNLQDFISILSLHLAKRVMYGF